MLKDIYKQKNIRCLSLVFLLMLGVSNVHAQTDAKIDESFESDDAPTKELVRLSFSNDVEIDVELADTPETRQLGLMYRRQMCEDCGMLFKFDSIRIASIWMKNTYIPLDLAYINAFGKIVDIKALEPHDLTSVPSSMPILYALEMNQGWFEKNGISEGDNVNIPSHLK